MDNRHQGAYNKMAHRNTASGGGKSKSNKVIIIPELDAIAKKHAPAWSDDELAVIKKYYGTVPGLDLINYLNKKFNNNRTLSALYNLKRSGMATDHEARPGRKARDT
jgi:hypothetical protein